MIRAFARRYPIRVFAELFGLPLERQEEFRDYAETWLHNRSLRQEAWANIRAVVQEQIEQRRRDPSDDMLSGIATGEIDGKLIDIDIAVRLASTVFIGGLDTLPSNIGWSFRYLAEHPADRQRITEEPSVVPNAIEEFLRMWTVTAKESRQATRDVEFRGARIRAGDRVQVLLALANHDGAAFPDPLTVDFDRPSNHHIAFAVGPHRCLGSHLARHELGVALEEWHSIIPNYRLDPATKLQYGGGGVFAVDALPILWDVEETKG